LANSKISARALLGANTANTAMAMKWILIGPFDDQAGGKVTFVADNRR
jgi:hypothetical protein